MTKLRVYELAKKYGMKGPEMADMLRNLGFSVKGHMSALDPADQMVVTARLEAQGLRPEASSSDSESAGESGGTGLKKIPKKLPTKKALPPASAPGAPKKLPKKKVFEEEQAAPAAPPAEASPQGRTPAATEPPATASTSPAAKKPAAPKPAAASQPTTPPAAEAPAPKTTAPKAPARETTAPKAADAPPTASQPAAPAAASETPAPSAETPPAEKPVAGAPAAKPGVGTPAEKPAAAGRAPAEKPAEKAPAEAAAAAGADAPAADAPAADAPAARAGDAAKTGSDPDRPVKRLIQPQAKAKVMGHIQLPESTIRDANRRSAPRDPGSVPHELRAKALSHTQSRSATRAGGQRRGPGMRGGPGPRGRGRDQGRGRKGRGPSLSTPIDPNKIIEIEPPITVKGLSEALGVKVNELLATLMVKLRIPGKTINSFLDNDEVELIALEINRNIQIVERKEAEEQLLDTLVNASVDINALQRAPVLTFMGHVDHGKTTLLDALRSSDVVKGEAGGITQHIGAYKITTKNDEQFVILDTPGHAAFTSMRARGASLTDIVVLVVAADDGVMPQTEEAINHAQAAGCPIVVAVNKSDAPGANSMQVRQQLSVKGLQAEEWGGSVQMVDVSAITGQGLDDLVEKIMLEAELLELEAKPDAPGSGVVIESRQSAEQGIVVNVLVTDGTLRVRDMVICGESYSRVRGMVDDHGNRIEEALPSTPVSITGLTKLPSPGDKFFVVEDSKKAKEVVEERQRRSRANDLADRSRVTVENLAAKLRDREIEEAKVILKADVMGSLEPIRNGMGELGTDEVRVNVIHRGLGAVTENDVALAEASDAIIIAFNTIPEPAARVAADRAGVEIRQYDVIYKLLDDMKLALEGLLKPDEIEEIQGHAEIKAIFKSSKFGNISGCLITDGTVHRNHEVRLTRDGKVIYRGKLGSLRRIDEDVREVREGYECGLTIAGYNDVKVGDVLETFTVKLIPRKLA